jgi:lipopolysaccharide transport system ATP-binding protein
MTMTQLAIEVEELGKAYRVVAGSPRYDTLRDTLAEGVGRAGAWLTRRARGAEANRFWALRDVSLEIPAGTVLGVIGRNGAGKSTLLKILARIVEPTTGKGRIRGRVVSLLEVGTGFHPELTGRDNIYLSGAILGMRREYVTRVFDEIVAFAGVQSHIEAPLKYFSSGMQLRLAVAVAAFVDADVLLLDEVLAVGDAEFQRRCLAAIDAGSHHGRTTVIVSHHMPTITRLCNEALWLEGGRVQVRGEPYAVVGEYLTAGSELGGSREWAAGEEPGNDDSRLLAVRVIGDQGRPASIVGTTNPVIAEVEFRVGRPLRGHRVAVRITTADGVPVFTTLDDPGGAVRAPGTYVGRFTIPAGFLNGGQYAITVIGDIAPNDEIYIAEDVLTFAVEHTGGGGSMGIDAWPGVVAPRLDWNVERVDDR